MSWWTKVLDVVTGGIGQKIGDVVDQLVLDKDLGAKLKQELAMANLLASTELQKAKMQLEREVQVEIEKTHQAELNQSDLYTKRTRPKIARQAWAVGIAYGLTTAALPAVLGVFSVANTIPTFDPTVFGTLVSPALWYMGMRGFDKWKENK